MPRGKSFDEQQALGKALELFWQKGYEATSLTDLTSHLGIGKGSFYDTFGSKQDLFNQAMEMYRAYAYSTLDTLLAAHDDPNEGIRSFLNMHTATMLSGSAAKGCFIANSTSALSDGSFMQSCLEDHNKVMKTKLATYLKKGVFADKAEAYADLILGQITGISVLSKVIDDPARFEAANDLFMQLLERQQAS